MKIILASNSPRRKDILNQIGINFEIIPSTFEEIVFNDTPDKVVEHFAYMKAIDVAKRVSKDSIIIGADTIVYLDKVMGKPKSEEDAISMLKHLSGKEHTVMTGVSVINNTTGMSVNDHEKTTVKFKELTDEEIQWYINTKEPFGKAGSYAVQGFGSLFVEGIKGCYFNVVGLPIFKLSGMLQKVGFKILK